MMKSIFLCLLLLLCQAAGYSQHLKPGFDKAEYLELLKVSARQGDTGMIRDIPQPEHTRFLYRSPVVGLENRWDLWLRDDQVAVISIRGTTASQVSWLANFYAAMVPAKGTLQLSATKRFDYSLADNPKAAVHTGWLIATAFLSEDMLPRLDSLYRNGIREMIIVGHSQGGAIAYLLNAYLHSLQAQGRLPSDIRFKTYCSAAPKPGNLFFAYDYEALTQEGWACNVVNSADWVPETPMSVQTTSDYNKTSLFGVVPELIRKQKIPMRWLFRYIYGRMDKPAKRTERRYRRYLGKFVARQVCKHLPGFVPPAYYVSSDYVRTGNTIILHADAAYYRQYPDNSSNIFIHHFFAPYIYLARQLPDHLPRSR